MSLTYFFSVTSETINKSLCIAENYILSAIFSSQTLSNFNHCDVIDPQNVPISVKITQNSGHYAIQGHSWSPISVPWKAVCDFLCVNSKPTNLRPVLHRFRDTAPIFVVDRSVSL